jgi:hypothetical protein
LDSGDNSILPEIMAGLKSGTLVKHINDRNGLYNVYRVVPAAHADLERGCTVLGEVIEREETFSYQGDEKPWLKYYTLTEGGYYIKK